MNTHEKAAAKLLIDALEDMARQHCYTQQADGKDKGLTDSGALSSDADALRLLGKLGRFRIEREGGRMVCGYWPENEPRRKP